MAGNNIFSGWRRNYLYLLGILLAAGGFSASWGQQASPPLPADTPLAWVGIPITDPGKGSRRTFGDDRKFGYIDQQGKMVIPARFEEARDFSEGLAWVRIEEARVKKGESPRYFINKKGEKLSIRGPQGIWHTNKFSEGLAAVKPTDSWGFIDATGETIIPPWFAGAGSFSEGLAPVQLERDFKFHGKWGFIDKRGNLVIPAQYYNGEECRFSEGLALVQVEPKVKGNVPRKGYINKEGQMVIAPEFIEAKDFSEGLAMVWGNHGGGYIDKQGKTVIPSQFHNAESFSEGLAAVTTEKDGKWGYINKQGKMVIPPQFSWAYGFSEGLAAVNTEPNGKMGFIDKQGKMVIAPQFYETGRFSRGLAAVKTEPNGKWGYINKHGKMVIAPQFLGKDPSLPHVPPGEFK